LLLFFFIFIVFIVSVGAACSVCHYPLVVIVVVIVIVIVFVLVVVSGLRLFAGHSRRLGVVFCAPPLRLVVAAQRRVVRLPTAGLCVGADRVGTGAVHVCVRV
jgi:hypothetical protein